MRIKLTTSMAGVGFAYKRGQEVEMDDATALRLLSSNQATQVIPAGLGVRSKDWPLAISPQEYLKRFPAGPNVALAHQVLGSARVETR